MKKLDILSIFFIGLSSALILCSLGFQIQEKKKQIICLGHLRHWYTALQIYHSGVGWRLRKGDDLSKWLSSVRSYLYDPAVFFCPSIKEGGENWSYKFNSNLLPQRRLSFGKVLPKKAVLLFDGVVDSSPMSNRDFPYREVVNRHLAGANLLFLDGSICYKAAIAEGIASKEMGWDRDGGYIWKLQPH